MRAVKVEQTLSPFEVVQMVSELEDRAAHHTYMAELCQSQADRLSDALQPPSAPSPAASPHSPRGDAP